MVVVGGETLADRDMTNYEWAMTMSGTWQSLWEASTSDDAPGGNVLKSKWLDIRFVFWHGYVFNSLSQLLDETTYIVELLCETFSKEDEDNDVDTLIAM